MTNSMRNKGTMMQSPDAVSGNTGTQECEKAEQSKRDIKQKCLND